MLYLGSGACVLDSVRPLDASGGFDMGYPHTKQSSTDPRGTRMATQQVRSDLSCTTTASFCRSTLVASTACPQATAWPASVRTVTGGVSLLVRMLSADVTPPRSWTAVTTRVPVKHSKLGYVA